MQQCESNILLLQLTHYRLLCWLVSPVVPYLVVGSTPVRHKVNLKGRRMINVVIRKEKKVVSLGPKVIFKLNDI